MLCVAHPYMVLGAAESAAVQRLVEHRRILLTDGGVTDVKSEAGYTACANFLSGIDAAAQAMGLRPAPRQYRRSFTANYRALFPDGNRHYRTDVLEACVDQQFDIWVNGQKFQLDPAAIERGQVLQACWVGLIAELDRWPAHNRPQLVAALVAFDEAWASFEEKYISALISIEGQARQLIVEAVKLEERLPADPATPPTATAECERALIQLVAKLNSIANYKGKGRDDLRIEVLDRARRILRQQRSKGQRAAEVLANDVVDSFSALRSYMRQVATRLEQVDPHLCNNVGLVARLVDYEESWEIGMRYICNESLLDAICDVYSELREAERIAPELTTMLEDCDVELFMVLPRLVILAFLADPTAKRAELVRMLLPHRFGPAGSADASFKAEDPELRGLLGRYKDATRQLGGAAKSVLVRRAVHGSSEPPARGDSPEADRAGRDLMLAAEQWSLELQRHCAEDWNQCSAILVHCLTQSAPKVKPVEFQV